MTAGVSLCRVYKRLLVRKTEITAAQRGAEEEQWKDEDTKIPLRGNRRRMSTLKDPPVARQGMVFLASAISLIPPGYPSFYPAGYSKQPHPWHLITLPTPG
ncbi:hypothetical protein ALC56_11881 [Trachymyrmex septentrionalis]|uniref:Uncharacterized protein n=1 Tax=Trachymyrmex septentrionalis TaxID=34720 RepID=A0A195EZS2_9HYME|nr:hypothetical protein ALC56_11881 [Trachymyrmex septentrionalis]